MSSHFRVWWARSRSENPHCRLVSVWAGLGIGCAAGFLRSVSAERWLNDGPMSFWLFAAAAALVTWVFCYWWNIHLWGRYRASLRDASLPD